MDSLCSGTDILLYSEKTTRNYFKTSEAQSSADLRIDLFRLYILFSQFKSCDNTQEDWFFVLLIKKSACKHEYVCMHSF